MFSADIDDIKLRSPSAFSFSGEMRAKNQKFFVLAVLGAQKYLGNV